MNKPGVSVNKGVLNATYNDVTQSNQGLKVNESMKVKENNLREIAMEQYKEVQNTIGGPNMAFLRDTITAKASSLAQKTNFNLKKLNNVCGEIFSTLRQRISMMNQVQKQLDPQTQQFNPNNEYTSGKADYSTTRYSAMVMSESELKEEEENLGDLTGYTECVNPFYEWGNSYYQGNAKKVGKATLLTLMVFILTMLFTNVIRIYFGGTPGGSFSSPGEKAIFQFFASLLIAPILEEPAKMISIRGGYGKHFFFAFNILEFGGHILLALLSGVSGSALGLYVLIRGVCVLFHALSMKIQASGGNRQSLGKSTIKVAITILLHFIFNALFMKYVGVTGGMVASKVLMFVIGFFGVAFGIFKIVGKRNNPSMTGNRNFTTASNLET